MALIDDAKHPAPARPPLQANPRRTYGPQRAKLVHCWNRNHGFYPDGESCPDCLSWAESLPRVAVKAADVALTEADEDWLNDIGAYGDGMWP